MCLSRPIDPPSEPVTEGYKWLSRLRSGSLCSPVACRPLSIGQWIEDDFDSALCFESHKHEMQRYRIGFHCFSSLSDAREHWIAHSVALGDLRLYHVEVDPKSVTAWGKDEGATCFVARRIKLLEEVQA